MLKKTHPGKVAYFGCIGKDEVGDVLEKETKEVRLRNNSLSSLESTPTSTDMKKHQLASAP